MGAVNAAWASQFAKGEEHKMADELVDYWLKVRPRDVYKSWPGGYLQGMFYEPSLFNTEPGEKYLRNRLTSMPKRYLAIGATNMNTGTFKTFNNFHQNLELDLLLDATMASVAVPGLFPYRMIGDDPYFDGSVIKSLDIASIINQCRFLNGNDDTKIVVDVILASDRKIKELEIENYNALRVLMRTRDLMSFEKGCIALIRAKQLFPQVNFRYIVKPSKAISLPDLPLNFKHKEIERMIKLGRQDAKTVVGLGEGVSFDEAIKEAKEIYGERYIEPQQNKRRRVFYRENRDDGEVDNDTNKETTAFGETIEVRKVEKEEMITI